MSQYWSPIVHSLKPYVPGEQPPKGKLIKLNTNENPYGPSSQVLAAIASAVNEDLRLYPDPSALELRKAIADTYHLSPDEVFVGNGSDEVLAHTFQGLLNHEEPLLFPDVTYSFYRTYCSLYAIPYLEIPVGTRMQIRVSDYQRACGAIILANPNAPTGIALPLQHIEELLCQHRDQVVVVDEAYVDFGGKSAVTLIRKHPNLLVVQTFSKSRGLAGLRIGFAMGQRPLIDALERVKDSFNSYPLDRPALAGAVAAWEDSSWFQHHLALLIASRQRLATELMELQFDVLPSAANFVFVRHPQLKAENLARALRDKDILVRHFSAQRVRNYLRITVGTEEQCASLVEALNRILQEAAVR